MEAVINSTKENLYKELNLPIETNIPALEQLAANDHRYLKDLRINISNVLSSAQLTKKEVYLTAYAVAINEKNEKLKEAFRELSVRESATEAELAEVTACVSLLNVNNVFYRFRHFMKKEIYEQTPAGIKMSIMMNPLLGKEFFELLSLVVSSLNGCELCVKSHEDSLIKHGTPTSRIFEAVRLGAVLKGIAVLV